MARGPAARGAHEPRQAPGVALALPRAGRLLVQFADDSANLNALVAGQVDAAGTVSYLASELNKRYPDKKFERKLTLTSNVYAMGVRRGDFDFQRWVNTFLFVNILNGAIPKAYEKWMGDAWKPLPAF